MFKVFITLFFFNQLFAADVGKRISLYSLNVFEKINALGLIKHYGKINQNCFFKHSDRSTFIDWNNELSWKEALQKLQNQAKPYLIYELKSSFQLRETLEEDKEVSRNNQFLVDSDFNSFKQFYNSKLGGNLFFLYKENSFQNAGFSKVKSYVMTLNHSLSHEDFFLFNDQTDLEELTLFIKKIILKKKFQGSLQGFSVHYPIDNETLQKISDFYYQEMKDKKIVFVEPLPRDEKDNHQNDSVTVFDYKKAELVCLKPNTSPTPHQISSPTPMHHSKKVSTKKQGQCPIKI